MLVRCRLRWSIAHAPSSTLHQSGASVTPNFLFILLPQLRGTAVQPRDSPLNTIRSLSMLVLPKQKSGSRHGDR